MTTERLELPEYSDSEEAQFSSQLNAVSRAISKIVAIFKQVTTLPAEHVKGRLIKTNTGGEPTIYYDDGTQYTGLNWKLAGSVPGTIEIEGLHAKNNEWSVATGGGGEGSEATVLMPPFPGQGVISRITAGPTVTVKLKMNPETWAESKFITPWGEEVEEIVIAPGGTVTLAVPGAINGKVYVFGDVVATWHELTLTGTHVKDAGLMTCAYRIVDNGAAIELRGGIEANGGAIAGSTTLFTLPEKRRPPGTAQYATSHSFTTTVAANVLQVTSGGVSTNKVEIPEKDVLHLDGILVPIR